MNAQLEQPIRDVRAVAVTRDNGLDAEDNVIREQMKRSDDFLTEALRRRSMAGVKPVIYKVAGL